MYDHSYRGYRLSCKASPIFREVVSRSLKIEIVSFSLKTNLRTIHCFLHKTIIGTLTDPYHHETYFQKLKETNVVKLSGPGS